MIMLSNQYLVSVIIPIYNVSAYLHQCVLTVCKQSYGNLEIILVNDGSTDEGLILCETFATKDSRVRVVNQKNMGLVSARQAGLRLSKGDYVLYVDGDDWLELHCVEKLIAMAEKHHSDIIVTGYYREFVGQEIKVSPSIRNGVYTTEEIKNKIFPKLIHDDKSCSHSIPTFSWGKLFKRELLFDHQMDVPMDISLGEDTVLTYPCIVSANSICVIDSPLYFYRQRAKSMLKSTMAAEDEIFKINRMCDFLALKVSGYGFDFNSQIESYRLILLAIRTGGLFGKENVPEWLFLNALNFKDKKIALYSSGAFGQQMWRKFRDANLNFCSWFDQDYYESQLCGVDVRPLEDLPVEKPDIIVVATFDRKKFNEVKKEISRFYNDCEIIHPLLPENKTKALWSIRHAS
jgi:glycosyltransferase involved in cell wall biosynthesis